jgi:hypothetical protein
MKKTKLFIRLSQLSAPLIVLALSLALTLTVSAAAPLTMQGGANSAKSPDQATDLFGSAGIFSTITNTLLFILGAISVIMIVIGGLRYVVSGGDSSAVTAAKNTILYAIVGVIVAILAYAVVNFVIGNFAVGGSGGGGGTTV